MERILTSPNGTSPNRGQTAGTVKAFRLLGVPVRLHFTFIIFLIFLIVTDLGRESSGSYALFILGLFASVLLHELGHALVALKFGVKTTEIVSGSRPTITMAVMILRWRLATIFSVYNTLLLSRANYHR